MACRGKVIVAMHLETIPTNYEWYVKKFYKGFFFFLYCNHILFVFVTF